MLCCVSKWVCVYNHICCSENIMCRTFKFTTIYIIETLGFGKRCKKKRQPKLSWVGHDFGTS